MLVSAGTDLKLYCWPDNGREFMYKPLVSANINSLSWSKDDGFITFLSENSKPEIISVRDCSSIRSVQVISAFNDASAVAFRRTTKRSIGVVTKSGQVALYDTKTKSIVKLYPSVSCAAILVDFNVNDKQMAVACANGAVTVYNLMDAQVFETFNPINNSSTTAMRFHPTEENFLSVATDGGSVILWDVNTKQKNFCAQTHTSTVSGLALSQTSNLLITVGFDNKFCIHDLNIHECIFRSNLQLPLTSVDFNPDGTTFGIGSQDGNIYMYDIRQYLQPMLTWKAHNSAVNKLLFDNNKVNLVEDVSDTSFETFHLEKFNRGRTTKRILDFSSKVEQNTLSVGKSSSEQKLKSAIGKKEQHEVTVKSLTKDVIESITKGTEELQNQLVDSFESLNNLIADEFRTIDSQMDEKWDILNMATVAAKDE